MNIQNKKLKFFKRPWVYEYSKQEIKILYKTMSLWIFKAGN